MTKSKNLVEMLDSYEIVITFKSVLEIEDTLSKSVCKLPFQDRLLCLSHLTVGLCTVSALDNLDYEEREKRLGSSLD